MARSPEATQPRCLGILANIADEKCSTIAFPLPADRPNSLRGKA